MDAVEVTGTVEFLSEEWVGLLGAAVAGVRVDPEVSLSIEQNVVDPDGSVFVWHLAVDRGRASAAVGAARAGPGRLVLSTDRETARSIAAGEASAQRLFLGGRLRLDGDAGLLPGARAALEALGEATVAIRGRTAGLEPPG